MRIGVDLTLLSESGLYKLIMRSDKPHRPPLPRLGDPRAKGLAMAIVMPQFLALRAMC